MSTDGPNGQGSWTALNDSSSNNPAAPTEGAEIAEDLLLLLSRLMLLLNLEFETRATIQHLTAVQLRVLWELHRPLNMSDIARVIAATRSAATSVVDGLVKRGLVFRAVNPANRREVWVDLTARGNQLRADIRRRQLGRLHRVAGRLADADAEIVTRAIGMLNQAARSERQSMTAGQRSVRPSLLNGVARLSTPVVDGDTLAQGDQP